MGFRIATTIVFFCLCTVVRVQAAATLFLEEPYSYDGTFAGTGHAAVYLSGVCATSSVVLRPCLSGERGIVLSRYRGIGGYDWIAIPLIPYLYAVERPEDIPLFADKSLVAFLRDTYRRNHLETIVPDLPDGDTPGGAWYQLIGASYLRTIYAFEIETLKGQDDNLIRSLNGTSNHQRWKLVTANCADFIRQIFSFYYPQSVHRSIIGDLGVTTPKQLARTLSKYTRRHPDLQASRFVIPQVPGTIPRSKRVRGVFEVLLTSKKYMLPIFLFHPYASAIAVAVYVEHWHFNPAKSTPIMDSNDKLGNALTSTDRRVLQGQLEELVKASGAQDADAGAGGRHWASLRADAVPTLDEFGGPALWVPVGTEALSVGITRSNILSSLAGFRFAAELVEARLREELTSPVAKKTARSDVEIDLALLQQLLASKPRPSENTTALATQSSAYFFGAAR